MTIAAIGKDLKDINELAETTGNKVVSAIKEAAHKTGVDFTYLLQKAQTESSLNPTAKAKGSSATGLYQFVGQTWLDTLDKHAAAMGRADIADAIQHTSSGKAYVADPAKRQEIMDLRKDPTLSACMAAALTQDNASCLKAQLGNDTKVGGTELYLAHFLGAGGASDLLEKLKTNPNAPAAGILPQAAAANHNVFYSSGGRALSVKEVYDRFAAKFGNSDTPVLADNGTTTLDGTTLGGMDVNATGEQAQKLATQIAMNSLIGGTGIANNFGNKSGSSMGSDLSLGLNLPAGMGGTGSSGSVYPAGYNPVGQLASANNISADGKVYSFNSGAAVDSNSFFYTMWLANEKSGSGLRSL